VGRGGRHIAIAIGKTENWETMPLEVYLFEI